MQLSNYNVVEENDFATAWYIAVMFVVSRGVRMIFGSEKEKKRAINSIQAIILYGNAINQILRGELHPQFPFNDKKKEEYTKEFNRDWFLFEYSKYPEAKKFVYLYIERLIRYTIPNKSIKKLLLKKDAFVDQLLVVRDQLKEQVRTGITSNRCQAITWEPFKDLFSSSPPCLQRIQIIYLGNNEVELHIAWRSRDLFTAWMVNLVGLVGMINREIVAPCGCRIVRITDWNTSLHIYEGDLASASKVRPPVINPQFMFRSKQHNVYYNGEFPFFVYN